MIPTPSVPRHSYAKHLSLAACLVAKPLTSTATLCGQAAKAAADGPEDAKEVPPAALVEEAQEVSVPSDPTCFTPPATPPDTMSPSADAAADSFLEDMAFSPANLQQGCEMPGPAAATDDAEAVACGTAHQNAAWGKPMQPPPTPLLPGKPCRHQMRQH